MEISNRESKLPPKLIVRSDTEQESQRSTMNDTEYSPLCSGDN